MIYDLEEGESVHSKSESNLKHYDNSDYSENYEQSMSLNRFHQTEQDEHEQIQKEVAEKIEEDKYEQIPVTIVENLEINTEQVSRKGILLSY